MSTEKPLKSRLNTSRRRLLKGGFASLVGAPILAARANAGESTRMRVSQSPPPRPVYQRAVSDPAVMERLFEEIKRKASPEELYRFLYAMPKGGDIHHHLGGGFLPSMWYQVAVDRERNGGQRFFTRFRVSNLRRHPMLNAPGVSYIFQWRTLNEAHYKSLDLGFQRDFKALEDLDEIERSAWMSAIVLDEKGEGRDEFFEYHWTRLGDLLKSIHVMAELLVENMKRFASEGVTYLELQRGAFHYMDENGRGISAEEAEVFWNERLERQDALETGVTVRWQGVAIRFADDAEDQVRRIYAWIDQHRETWVGINMAGREDDNRGYPKRFTKVYDEMLRKYPGIGISIHAGEAEKPDSYIRDTLRLGASRIGHGINLLSDPDTMLRMRESKFLVEINLISNELLGYVPDLAQHPFPIYLRQGIPVCLNTDDRGMWDSNFTDEYYVAVSKFNLSWSELRRMNEASYEHSFADAGLKAQLLEDFRGRMDTFEKQFSMTNWSSVVNRFSAVTYGYGHKTLGLNI